MIPATAKFLESRFNLPYDRGMLYLNRLMVTFAAASFVLMATLIVALEDVFPGQTAVESLQIGDRVSSDILAPKTWEYISPVLTEQRREEAVSAVRPIYDPPDPTIARQQTELSRQILDYISNIRRDTFSTNAQKADDIKKITALALDDAIITYILELDTERWQNVDTQIITVLERIMRNEIQDGDLARTRTQLPNQVSVQFNQRESDIIVAVISDLLRANTAVNEVATSIERERAASASTNVTRSFITGQVIVPAGKQIDRADYEALEQLGLLQSTRSRLNGITRALLGSIIAMVIIGLYVARFQPTLLYSDPRVLVLLSLIFLITLAGARVNGLNTELYLYPSAVMALLFVVIINGHIAIIGTLGLALLLGLMTNNSLEIASLVAVGGLIGTLTLRRAERLNSFFFAGLMVSVGNIAVVTLFNLGTSSIEDPSNLLKLISYSAVNGILTATVAMAGMYVVTLMFNLPTALKLVELSQPNQFLMQKLLREAPGTYQHSLQVANLCEQAGEVIGVNAALTRVAALYHDIGKTLNPAFFTENQGGTGNPHDALNDPYRSADIIISHVIDGDAMAKQYRLPNRIRDFIREHHGTSQVYVFYKQALILAGDDESLVNPADFTYPGPTPQSRETGLMMLADACEAAVRSREPKTPAEIEEVVKQVIDDKRKTGQLNDSSLTLNDLNKIQTIFIEILQAIRHPRINYAEAVAKVRRGREESSRAVPSPTEPPKRMTDTSSDGKLARVSTSAASAPALKLPAPVDTPAADDDDAPMVDVPRLRRSADTKPQVNNLNGGEAGTKQADTTITNGKGETQEA